MTTAANSTTAKTTAKPNTTSNPTTAKPTTPSTIIVTDFQQHNFGPVTSFYQPPISCIQILTSVTDKGDLYVGHWGQHNFDPACYPPGSVGPAYLQQSYIWDIYYWSPAICPSGWQTATSFTSTLLGLDYHGTLEAIRLGTDTSVFVCCPTGFKYAHIGHQCTSVVPLGATLSYIYPTKAGTSQDRGTVSTSSVDGIVTVWCDGIPIWQQVTDAAVLSAASTITSSSSSPTRTQPPPTRTQPPPTASVSPGGGLSTGTKAAIGVVIPVVFLAIVFGVFWFFRTRRRNRVAGYELPGSSADKAPKEHGYELAGKHGHELSGEQRAELHTDNGVERQELPGH